jgi:hypothetical protein
MSHRSKRQRMTGLTLAALALSLVVTVPPARANLQQKTGNGSVDWTAGTITVTGSGAAPDRGSLPQKRLLAQRAAVADGYRQLAEIINGVHVDSETLVKDFVVESDVIKTQVSALVRGARPAAPRFLSDGAVEVDVTCSLYGQSGLSGITTPALYDTADEEDAVLPGGLASMAALLPVVPADLVTHTDGLFARARSHKRLSRKPAPKPPTIKPAAIKPTAATPPYTGVIIDCSGLGAEPAMSPTILDSSEGELYFGTRPMSDAMADFVINEGIVSYVHTMAEAKANERAGRNPLTVRATRVDGRFRADAVLKDADAQMLAGAENSAKILTNAKVVFIL